MDASAGCTGCCTGCCTMCCGWGGVFTFSSSNQRPALSVRELEELSQRFPPSRTELIRFDDVKGSILIVRNGWSYCGVDADTLWQQVRALGNTKTQRTFRVVSPTNDDAQEEEIGTTTYSLDDWPVLAKARQSLGDLNSRLHCLVVDAFIGDNDGKGLGVVDLQERQAKLVDLQERQAKLVDLQERPSEMVEGVNIVIGLIVGEDRCIEWQRFQCNMPVLEPVIRTMRHGDFYAMSGHVAIASTPLVTSAKLSTSSSRLTVRHRRLS